MTDYQEEVWEFPIGPDDLSIGYKEMFKKLKEIAQNEKGATLVEYSFLGAVIAAVVLTFFIDINQDIRDLFPAIWSALSDFQNDW